MAPVVGPALSTLDTVVAELPPGDVYAADVVNDTATKVDAFGCDGDDCTRGWDPATLVPDRASGWNEDQFDPVQLGVADSKTHVLLGCLKPPHAKSAEDEVAETVTLRASQISDCPGVGRVVTYFDPFAG